MVPAGARIPGVPDSDFYAALRYGGRSGWNAITRSQCGEQRPVNDLNTAVRAGLWCVELKRRLRVRCIQCDNYHVFRLNNIFDHSYVGSVIVNESNGRYYEPATDRNIFAGVRIDWKH